MTNKPPTDAAIIKGFEKFEQGFNVAMELVRTGKAGTSLGRDDIPTITPTHAANALWAAHNVYRELAIAAQERIDQKKGKGGS